MRLTLKELELLKSATAYNAAQHSSICGKAALELIEYKKIEAELGIDLITLFKALSGKYAVKEDDGSISVEWSCPRFYAPTLFGHNFPTWISIRSKNEEKYLFLKDYGKTWALTKEELL